ncbi:outer membrane protein assembly factor BamB [Polaromonas sp.]|uniref:outer membrane protein assembly factor BamB n=1 Tax=Polaromonas sp. TaxID=1869339 RepID=UPI002869FE89|nr:outer membrane protein assembly factor BamB [Polaromonas sp.]
MKYPSFKPLAQVKRAGVAIVLIATLSGCFGGGATRPQPAELQAVTALVSARQSWSARVGEVNFPLQVSVSGNSVAVASGDGTVALLDAQTGRDVWRVALNTPVAAGVGSDGKVAAIVTKANEVVALQDGRELWRQKVNAQTFTAPFVAGGRVFVLAGDRSVNAFDGQTGRKLWVQQRPSEPLVLRQSGVMLAVGDTLVVGLAGRLAGLDPSTGSIRWEAPLASPRGVNDIERLVDLVGRVSRQGDVVCARAFQASIGCVNAARGSLLWTKPANGVQGIDGDDNLLLGSEADGTVLAWRRSDGERVWTTDRLRYRSLTAPLVAGRSVVIGDFAGFVHLLSRDDGSLLNRLPTDGSAIAAAPVLAGNTLVAVTHNGGIFGFKPE